MNRAVTNSRCCTVTDDYDKAVRKSEDLRTKHDVDTTDTDASPHTVNQPPPPPIIPVPESSAFGG